ncbi:MAG: MotA/TolQ/ExbB proton channel family protein [Deltaproteobacteria bacterium]|nr:MotA/TolQ/ExbB proton channel family protein [Deltaproteobacteria bacterium]
MLLYTLLEVAANAAQDLGQGFTMREIWEASGFIARSVIVVLAIMLIACTYVALERLIAFNRARSQSMKLAAEVVAPLQQGDITTALSLARDDRFKAAYLGSLLKAGLAEVEERFDPHAIQNGERAVGKSIVEEQGKLRRGMAILATTGSTAPFVGLFGTTFGVINAFQGMATAGSGLASVSKGIAEALITTGVGIGVAVVGVWFFNYFNGRIEKVTDEMTASEADFMDWAYKLLHDREEAQKKAGK